MFPMREQSIECKSKWMEKSKYDSEFIHKKNLSFIINTEHNLKNVSI